MTLSKFSNQPTNKEVVDTINDIIDTMGSTQGANIDLSNLSATGESKFQVPLESGTNIKTINSESILGGGDVKTQIPLIPGDNIDISYCFSEKTQNANLGGRNWRRVVYGNGKFVAIDRGGYKSVSNDGLTWSAATNDSWDILDSWSALTFDGTKFVMFGEGGYIRTSTNGIDWSDAEYYNVLNNFNWMGIAYGNGKFVAISKEGSCAISTNGTTWTIYENVITANSTFAGITFGNGKFVTVCGGGIFVTEDGVTWTQTETHRNDCNGITFDGTRFVVLNYQGAIFSSIDTINWVKQQDGLGITSGNWYDITFNNGKFVALGGYGYISVSNNYGRISAYGLVSKYGDTMTRNLKISNLVESPKLILQKPAFDYTTTTAPSSNVTIGDFLIQDGNGNTTGSVRTIHNTYNNIITGMYAQRSVSGTQKTANVITWVDSSGNPHSQFSQTACCDGQWVSLGQTILDDASLTSSSSVSKTVNLPNDGHKYEVLFTGEVTTKNTNGSYIKLQVSTNQMGVMYVCGARTRAAATVGARGSILTVASYGSGNLSITRNSDFTGTATLIARAYRRIGTNT